MKITLLGTGTPNPSLRRQSSGCVVTVGEETLVFDHGPGAHHRLLEAGMRAVDVTHAFFSHLHYDHFVDFDRLVLTRWDQGAGRIPELRVYGPEHMIRVTELLFGEGGVYHPDLTARTNFPGSVAVYQARGGVLPRRPPAPLVEAIYEGQVITGTGWTVTVHEVQHQQPFLQCYGFRLETDKGVFVYSGDTGPCEGIEKLSRNADVLVHICNYVSGTALNEGMERGTSGHMEIARLAARTNVKTLVVTHVTPQMDHPGIHERLLGEMAEVFKGTIIWGEDLMTIPLRPAPLEKPV